MNTQNIENLKNELAKMDKILSLKIGQKGNMRNLNRIKFYEIREKLAEQINLLT